VGTAAVAVEAAVTAAGGVAATGAVGGVGLVAAGAVGALATVSALDGLATGALVVVVEVVVVVVVVVVVGDKHTARYRMLLAVEALGSTASGGRSVLVKSLLQRGVPRASGLSYRSTCVVLRVRCRQSICSSATLESTFFRSPTVCAVV
jgi:hypothetical protein